MQGLTDRDLVLKLQARVAELEDEVAAWKAYDRDRGRVDIESARFAAVLAKLRPFSTRTGVQAPARLLMVLLDSAGRLVTLERCLEAARKPDGDEEPSSNLVGVVVCVLRAILSKAGHRGAITLVWGRGYMIEAEVAERINAWLGPAAAKAAQP